VHHTFLSEDAAKAVAKVVNKELKGVLKYIVLEVNSAEAKTAKNQ